MSAGAVLANAGKVSQVQKMLYSGVNDTPRGRHSYVIRMPKGIGGAQTNIYKRGRRAKAGDHCHSGDNPHDPDRNPEAIYFLEGRVILFFEDLWGDKRRIRVVVPPLCVVVVKIPPWVLHKFNVGNQGVTYAEIRSEWYQVDDPSKCDIISEPDFRIAQQNMPSETHATGVRYSLP